MIRLLSSEDQDRIRISAQILSKLLRVLHEAIKPGVSGLDIDKIAINFLKTHNVLSNFKNYHGYPNTICVSVNSDLIHGIPNSKPFKSGDIVSVDAGCIYEGLHSDAAFSKVVEPANVEAEASQLVLVAKQALLKAVAAITPGIRVGTIGAIIQQHVTERGFYLTEQFAGHGIGKSMHLDPLIPNVGVRDSGPRLQPGTAVCIEPMVQTKNANVRIADDNWTVTTSSQGLAAHYEAMVLINEDGCELLTTII